MNDRRMPDPFERERELVQRGAMLPESAAGLTSGIDHKPRHPTATGYEMERSLCVGGVVLAEWEAAAIAAGVAESGRQDFRRGWWLASIGYLRPRAERGIYDPIDMIPASEAELAGWDAFPGRKSVDPWAHLTDADELDQRRNEWDEKRSKLKGDAA